MQNKLQELTDKLYNEGLSKGKQEGEELVAKAKKEADFIISKAKEQAAQIIDQAEKNAAELGSKTESDVKMASVQAISAVKQQVENAITASAVNAPVKALFSDKEYLKSLITSVIKAFQPSMAEGESLDVILPASAKSELGGRFEAEISSILSSGIDVKFEKGMAQGFKVGPKDGGYRICFTDEAFSSLIGEYLRPATKKILFG